MTSTTTPHVPLHRAGRRPTVADAMLTDVKLSDTTTTAAQLRRLFENRHVHAAVVLDGPRLVAVVERADLVGVADPVAARVLGRRAGRTVAPDADLDETWTAMRADGRRRLAVVDADGTFRGLLCLKRTGSGFCTDNGVRDRRRSAQGG